MNSRKMIITSFQVTETFNNTVYISLAPTFLDCLINYAGLSSGVPPIFYGKREEISLSSEDFFDV